MLKKTATITALAAGSMIFGAAPALAQGGNAQVSVLHAVPDATVDVYVNGDLTLEDFKPGTLTDPLTLPAGDYDLKVTAPDAGKDGEAIVEANDVQVPANANITVAAHLDEAGKPELTPFVNDTTPTAPGQARLTARHIAAAPAVDIRADAKPVFKNVTNPNEGKADVPAGTASADVVLAGTDQVVLGPANLDLVEGQNTIVYAWGSAKDNNLQLATQTVGGLHSAPMGVPAGNGGAADNTSVTVAAGLVALSAAAAAGAVIIRRKSA
ncbi:DUF4397 domain-containing protein [Corynebacterium heidelbergense]|uniref:DUF4397 domain-containing protein n=1 Tax=Corynebacterium heidelbergense TaxID=2055947 RepID=A0A364VDE6_9CORY|nr:DUF4397 domain-containing protein [Corynebacterium heidelbergense]RAV34667.1 hypothetical protein CWC39_01950 [Corynebacterium heidelbergense]WCZ36239.1 hypothetical protein CHEID_03420 [Corynebacterium heidelbergense]